MIRRNGGGIDENFTVRKVSYNVGVERIFPLHSPKVSKIEIKQRGHVRRARLYYLRELQGKAARIQQARYTPEKDQEEVQEEKPKKKAEAKPKEAKKKAQKKEANK